MFLMFLRRKDTRESTRDKHLCLFIMKPRVMTLANKTKTNKKNKKKEKTKEEKLQNAKQDLCFYD